MIVDFIDSVFVELFYIFVELLEDATFRVHTFGLAHAVLVQGAGGSIGYLLVGIVDQLCGNVGGH